MDILFAGTPEFAASHLSALLASEHRVLAVLTQPDKPGKRGNTPVASPVKQLALAHHLEVLQPQRLSAEDIRAFNVDVIVVVAYGQILKRDVLALPRLGCINVHASLLPRWRGAAPIQRAIEHGDDMTGVCIMKMDAGLDTGAVYRRVEVPIEAADTSADLEAKLVRVGCPALVDTLHDLAAGTATAAVQKDEGVTYAHKIRKEEAAIDFRLPANRIALKVRAFFPDPGAYGFLASLRVRILAATVQKSNAGTVPGEIISLTKAGLLVACGTDSILITRLQLPVGKGTVLSASDLLNSRRNEFAPGQRFDITDE